MMKVGLSPIPGRTREMRDTTRYHCGGGKGAVEVETWRGVAGCGALVPLAPQVVELELEYICSSASRK